MSASGNAKRSAAAYRSPKKNQLKPLVKLSMLLAQSNRENEAPARPSLMTNPNLILPILVRHESESPKERSTCGWRHRLISRHDKELGVAAWVHAVDIDGAREHYHKRSAELYYVLEGEGTVRLDGLEHPVRKGSVVHIPPGVIHGATGRVRVLVVGIPDIAEDDLFFPESTDSPGHKG